MLGSTISLRKLLSRWLTSRCEYVPWWIQLAPHCFISWSYYKALVFYLQEQPNLLNDLLTVLTPRIDHTRVVRMFSGKDNDNVPLIKPYLISVQQVRFPPMSCVGLLILNRQQLNIESINDAYNELLIDEEDYKTLRDSIDSFDNFNTMALARKLEQHELLEFRRLAAHLYKVSDPLWWPIFQGVDKYFSEKQSMGRVHIVVQTRQAVQGCYPNCICVRQHRSCWRTPLLFRRHWQQGMLCSYALCLLRPPAPRYRHGNVMA